MQNSNSVFDFFKTQSDNCIFSRIIGTNNTLVKDLLELDKACYQTTVYRRIDVLPKLTDIHDIEFYIKKYDAWRNSKKRVATTKDVSATHVFSSKIGKAIALTLNQYNNLSTLNDTLEKNFVIKLLFWFDFLLGADISKIEEGKKIKVICPNIKTKNEYLFFYFLNIIGANIILLQTKDDIDQKQKQLNLSNEITIGNFSYIDIPNFKNTEHNTEQKIKKSVKQNTEQTYEYLASLASSVVMITTYNDKSEILCTGSGIIIGHKGYILTNCHVVAGGVKFSVKLENDNTEYHTDKLIKYHNNYDLAILNINKILNPIPVYKGSDKLVRGQKVVAIGSPLGFFNSVSDGIISGFRNINNIDMIQFTAPISSGSSGGAVLNIYGEVIGISTAEIHIGQNINLAVGYEYINDFIGGFIS